MVCSKISPVEIHLVMEISVVVTNYNYGKYLGRCLRSLLNQSISKNKYEVIVIDDCSTDDSRAVLSTFNPEIRILELAENSGLSIAANTGIRSARGRYVVRVDADDYVHQDFLRVLLLGFEFFGIEFQAISLDYLEVSPIGETLKYGSQLESPIACAVCFKMDAIEQIGLYNEELRIHEEVDLLEKFQSSGFGIRNIAMPLYRYVRHKSSLTSQTLI